MTALGNRAMQRIGKLFQGKPRTIADSEDSIRLCRCGHPEKKHFHGDCVHTNAHGQFCRCTSYRERK